MTESERDWIEGKFETLRGEVTLARIDIAGLKVKASLWGIMGGVLSSATVLAIAIAMFMIKRG